VHNHCVKGKDLSKLLKIKVSMQYNCITISSETVCIIYFLVNIVCKLYNDWLIIIIIILESSQIFKCYPKGN